MIGELKLYDLSEEYPVTMYINGSKLLTLMCTPSDLKELAIGHLINTGIIKDFNDIQTVGACEDLRKVFIMAENVKEDKSMLKEMFSTGCGSGHDISDKLDTMPVVESYLRINLKRVQEAFTKMYKDAFRYQQHGGIHASAIVYNSEVVTKEDVARHNSHDKVTGYGAIRGWDLNKCVIITTGRISADMVCKAVNSRVPIICSRSNPTTLAVELANRCGITLIGRAMSKEITIFTHRERVVL
ncbi:MAG: formate dehydrogenase accessory sulfurtransferase FdhD [Gudongella sp.]|nr:formate dehydrogenase accessory sulfurtransferase FdhD [Gudongella sp.]